MLCCLWEILIFHHEWALLLYSSWEFFLYVSSLSSPTPAIQSRVSPNVPNDTWKMALFKIFPKTHHLTFPSSKTLSEPPKNLIDLTVNSTYLTARWILHHHPLEGCPAPVGLGAAASSRRPPRMGTRWHLLGGLHLVMLMNTCPVYVCTHITLW